MVGFAIFGWIVLLIILLVISVAWGFLFINYMGEYNMFGGVPNNWEDRLFVICAGGIVGWFWYSLLNASPFVVTVMG